MVCPAICVRITVKNLCDLLHEVPERESKSRVDQLKDCRDQDSNVIFYSGRKSQPCPVSDLNQSILVTQKQGDKTASTFPSQGPRGTRATSLPALRAQETVVFGGDGGLCRGTPPHRYDLLRHAEHPSPPIRPPQTHAQSPHPQDNPRVTEQVSQTKDAPVFATTRDWSTRVSRGAHSPLKRDPLSVTAQRDFKTGTQTGNV